MTKRTIFLIDDDDDSRPFFRKGLKQEGYQVSIAIDEEDALDRTERCNLEADLILMNFARRSPEAVLEMGRNIRRAGDFDVSIVVVAHEYGEDLEGTNIKIGDKDYIIYLDDGHQLYSLISALVSNRLDHRLPELPA